MKNTIGGIILVLSVALAVGYPAYKFGEFHYQKARDQVTFVCDSKVIASGERNRFHLYERSGVWLTPAGTYYPKAGEMCGLRISKTNK